MTATVDIIIIVTVTASVAVGASPSTQTIICTAVKLRGVNSAERLGGPIEYNCLVCNK